MIIQVEVERLLKMGMIRDVKYPRWLANVVVVLKKNDKWRVCVDFTDLNKACLKDAFPLASHRLNGGCYSRPRNVVLYGCILGIPANLDGAIRLGRYNLHDTHRYLLLYYYVVQP